MNDIDNHDNKIDNAIQNIQKIRTNIRNIVVGQEDVIDQVIVVLLCRGHILLEGLPGLGKTLLVKSLATCFSGKFKRIQFTPDLMPSDITGHALYDMHSGKFSVRKGPVFTHLLLADEINRSPAKTQAALLEVMQEQQATIEGKPYPIEGPFMVLATQNPIEQEGTYPLPEAELDRFLLKVFMEYPALDDEKTLVKNVTSGSLAIESLDEKVSDPLTPEDIIELQQLTKAITVDDQVIEYAVRLVHATRHSGAILKGAGPRASIGIITAAKAWALMNERRYVLPDDVKAMAIPVMRHRVLLSPDTEIDGFTPDQVLEQVVQSVDAPRQ
ncbi:AAA family ATPase [Marinibactrum halimedae]|uniref:MoxR family ATPase n=1 Tax=Marinibactrum halimedae TaxID=1444977 RepID=A0AA37TFD3_9GAMM|nr:MoxR family ATPase [Marinibactrum halimedae]MCD9460979.1 MoxR family ATPase [Marinibactrum halimedae]GLS28077.1 hypothetical protein GCM10007877_37960 [Marinibactrum halimedae]